MDAPLQKAEQLIGDNAVTGRAHYNVKLHLFSF